MKKVIFILWLINLLTSCVTKKTLKERYQEKSETRAQIERVNENFAWLQRQTEAHTTKKISEAKESIKSELTKELKEKASTNASTSNNTKEVIIERIQDGKVVEATRRLERESNANKTDISSLERYTKSNYQALLTTLESELELKETQIQDLQANQSKIEAQTIEIKKELDTLKKTREKKRTGGTFGVWLLAALIIIVTILTIKKKLF